MIEKPNKKPNRPFFSSGPCVKRPEWSPDVLKDAALGRSHRSDIGLQKLNEVIKRSSDLLKLPKGYKLAIVPASDTGAVEMALWNFIGARGVDVLSWEVFGQIWQHDITQVLNIKDVRCFDALEYSSLPDLTNLSDNGSRDVVFTWNGTTAGVKIPHTDWISNDRDGLIICDATSAVFTMDMPFDKLDVITWSWQKVLGGEAGFGMIALSPRALKRLETYTPPWPIPKIMRFKQNGLLNIGLFEGKTLNTPSMLAVEDCLDSLKWIEHIGGIHPLQKRTQENFKIIEHWVKATDWVDFIADDPNHRSETSITLKITAPWFCKNTNQEQWNIIREIVAHISAEAAGYDFANHTATVPGFRIWAGGTVETQDIINFLPWLDWAYNRTAPKI